jgi:hypothetical protein
VTERHHGVGRAEHCVSSDQLRLWDGCLIRKRLGLWTYPYWYERAWSWNSSA